MKQRVLNGVLAAAVGLGAAGYQAGALAAVVTDQQSPVVGTGFNVHSVWMDWQQEVRVGETGKLVGLDLFYDHKQPQDFGLEIFRGAGWHDTGSIAEMKVTAFNGTIHVDLSAFDLSFNAGEFLVFGVRGLGPIKDCCALKGNSGAYAAGALWFSGEEWTSDFGFVTYMNDGKGTTVPEPASLGLLGLGLVGLAGQRRRVATAPRPRA